MRPIFGAIIITTAIAEIPTTLGKLNLSAEIPPSLKDIF